MTFIKHLITLGLLLPIICQAAQNTEKTLPPFQDIAHWHRAGLDHEVEEPKLLIDFQQSGGMADGKTDNSELLQYLIDHQEQSMVILIPAGDYLFKSTIHIAPRPEGQSLIIRGANRYKTRLIFDVSNPGWGGLFSLRGDTLGDPAQVLEGAQQDHLALILDDASDFKEGDGVIISQQNNLEAMGTFMRGNGMPERQIDALNTWAGRCVGQSNRVHKVLNNRVMLDLPLTTDYTWGDVTLQRIRHCRDVGLEHFSVLNRSDIDGLNSFAFNNTTNCWMDGVNSHMTVRFHVAIYGGYKLAFRNCFFNNAYRHGGGGHGYGIACAKYANHCLIENNVFIRLRHSMMVKEGANANVFAYNYSFDGIQDEAPVAKDISIHGHYPFKNLFEGNVVEFIHCSDYWGAAGPQNTFFRNRITRAGIQLQDYSPEQFVLGNQLLPIGDDAPWLWHDNYHIIDGVVVGDEVLSPRVVHNRTRGEEPDEGVQFPASLYRKTPPDFWQADMPWPAIGPELPYGSHRIPAQDLWDKIKAALFGL